MEEIAIVHGWGPETIRGMIETMLHILSNDPGEKPAKTARTR
jgi:hypothetical protein